MPTKSELLNQLSVRKLRALAKENNVSLKNEYMFGNQQLTRKNDIVNRLSESRKITKKKIEAKIAGKTKKTAQKGRAKRRGILAADRSKILERQKGKCDICGKKLDLIHNLYEIDHKTPIADGGTDKPDNFHALCLECHRKKTRMELAKRAKEKRRQKSSTTSRKRQPKRK